MTHKFPYEWKIKDGYPAKGIEAHGLKVFSTFSCGGGSSFGYKLAGYDVIGANDIDPKMAKAYKANHNPKHYFLCPIGKLYGWELPDEMFNLDILDGSPPCSTFSFAGDRDKAFKVEKKFKEGQAKQVLSDLFFDFLDLAEKLKPKVIVAENVKGMLAGNAKAYTKLVMKRFDEIGYNVQLFCLNAATMGVPQKRERVFFIASRKDLMKQKLILNFNEKPITFKEVNDFDDRSETKFSKYQLSILANKPTSTGICTVKSGKNTGFYAVALNNRTPLTLSAGITYFHSSKKRLLNDKEIKKIGSFPMDYKFIDDNAQYMIGMSVPPVMVAQIANEIYKQWFK